MLKNPFRLFRYLFRHTKWRIGVARSSPSEILKRGLDACLFKWLEFNNSAINADPFILHRNGNYYIFYEDLDYKTNLILLYTSKHERLYSISVVFSTIFRQYFRPYFVGKPTYFS